VSPAGEDVPARRRSWRSLAETLPDVVAPALLIGALTWQMFEYAEFSGDWSTHLWYVWHQSLSIRANHVPSLFLNYSGGVFDPLYAFYGGTLYALAGTLSLILGNAPLSAYVLTYLAGFAAAYGGWYWMARMAGLGRWPAHVPGALFITSPYYLTLIYGRGDWPEFIAVSSMPLVVAAGLSVALTDRPRLAPAFALAGSGIVFCGSHNLTLLWGTTILLLGGLAIVLCVPEARRAVSRNRAIASRRVLRVASFLVPALLVSAWFLVPTVSYQSHTHIASSYPYWRNVLQATTPLVSAANLFTISRATDVPQAADFALSLPIAVIAWVLASMAILARARPNGTWMRLLLVVVGMTIGLTIVMTHAGLVLALPRPYVMIQFTYRLESYVLLGLSGAVLVILKLMQGGGRRLRLWMWTVSPILILSVIGAIQQANAYTGGYTTIPYFKNSDPGLLDYTGGDLPTLASGAGNLPKIEFPPTAVRHDRVSVTVHLPPGQLVDTNIMSLPELVHITDASVVGVDPTGHDLLRLGPSATTQANANESRGPTETISVSPADALPIKLGRLLTLLGAFTLIVRFSMLAIARRRRGT
jgi:hypothetical protein